MKLSAGIRALSYSLKPWMKEQGRWTYLVNLILLFPRNSSGYTGLVALQRIHYTFIITWKQTHRQYLLRSGTINVTTEISVILSQLKKETPHTAVKSFLNRWNSCTNYLVAGLNLAGLKLCKHIDATITPYAIRDHTWLQSLYNDCFQPTTST